MWSSSIGSRLITALGFILSSYDYKTEFRTTKAHANVDSQSRLPLPAQENSECLSEVSTFNVAQINTVSVSVTDLSKATRSLLSYQYLEKGWPAHINNALKPYGNRHSELSIEEGCILWGARVVIPKKFQSPVLKMLHEVHMGMVRVKRIA